MSGPRIEPLSPPYAEDVSKAFGRVMPEGVPPLKLFATLAHNPRVLNRFLNGGLLDRGSLTLRQREIVILRTTALCGSEYEWGVHVQIFADHAKLTEEEIRATVHGISDDPVWNEPERRVVQLCDSLVTERRVNDAVWAGLTAHFATAQIVELVVLCGFYQTVSLITETFQVDLETGAPRFPDK